MYEREVVYVGRGEVSNFIVRSGPADNQERSESQPTYADMLNGMADGKPLLFDDETSAGIFAVPKYDDLRFEEWLGTYGKFQQYLSFGLDRYILSRYAYMPAPCAWKW